MDGEQEMSRNFALTHVMLGISPKKVENGHHKGERWRPNHSVTIVLAMKYACRYLLPK